MASEVRLGKREYVVTGTALVRFKIRTQDDSPTDARDTVGCMDIGWLEGAEEACIEEVNIDTVNRAPRAASKWKELPQNGDGTEGLRGKAVRGK